MNLATKISLARILLVPFFVASILYYKPDRDFLRFVALALFGIAVLSDAIDGFIARKFNQKTELGTFVDPLADKLLLISAFIVLTVRSAFPYKIPAWVTLIVISRDIMIALGSMLIYIFTQNLEIIPSKLGKITTFFQMMTIISALLHFEYSYIVWVITALFTILSGIGYLRRGSLILNGGFKSTHEHQA